jgi:GxxExxY protein
MGTVLTVPQRRDAKAQRMDDRDSLNHTSFLIIRSAINIHRHLGPGLLESVYRTCLVHDLLTAGQVVVAEQNVPIYYDGLRLDGGYRLDLLVNNKVIVETKAVERLLPVHYAQLLSYLRLTDKRLGLLINFNVPCLVDGLKRIVNRF